LRAIPGRVHFDLATVMSSCCSSFCSGAQRQFGPAVARHDLERFRERGPDATTRLLCEGILNAGGKGALLDVGAGIGALSFELLAAGFEKALAVDASSAYVAAARDEAARRGRTAMLELVEGDFVTVAPALPVADVVAMNRVVCCYPAAEPLLEAALSRSSGVFAFSYPRDRWYVRAFVTLQNVLRALAGNTYRGYVHPARSMHAVIERRGFRQVSSRGGPVWCVEVHALANAVL